MTPGRHVGDLLGGRLPAVGVGVLCTVVQFMALVQGGFFLDDFANLARNKHALSLGLLTSPIGTNHFQPATQFLVWIAAEPLRSNYPATVACLAVITGLGTYWMIRLTDELFGPRVLHLVLGLLLGTSWILLSTNQWFAASAAAASAAWAAGAGLSFVRWLGSGRWRHYLCALAATAVAIGFWESALAVPAILALLWACFAFDRRRPVRVLVGLVPFFALSLAYLLYVEAQPWADHIAIPSASQWADLLWVMVVRALVPSVVGTGVSRSDLSTNVGLSDAVVVTGLALAAFWLWRRGRLRWSSLPFFLVGLVLVSAPVATERQGAATAVGTTSRYLTFLPLLLALAVAGAVRAAPASEDGARRDAGGAQPRWAWWLVGCAVAAGCLLYLANLAATFSRDPGDGRLLGDRASVVSGNIAAGLEALPRSEERSIVDASLPAPVWYAPIFGYVPKNGEFHRLMPNWSSTARTFGEGPALVGLDGSGHLRPASFVAAGTGSPETGSLLYEKIVVTTPRRTTMRVLINGVRPVEPLAPWTIPVGPGTHSFVLPVWSSTLHDVRVSGPGVRVDERQTGTLLIR